MKKPLLKIIVLFLFTSFSWAGVSAVGWTEARFSDTEISETNICQMGTLDFSLDPPEIGEAVSGAPIKVEIVKEGTLDFQYKVKAELSGNKNFCGDLEIVAVMGGDTYYDGQLKDFKAFAIISGTQDKWEFKITDPENNPAGKVCDFKFIFKGWQEDIDKYMDSGFSDKEVISGTVKSEGEVLPEPGDVIINEVMWMGSKDKNDPAKDSPKDQWIELKNVSGKDLHLKGWYLTCKKESAENENKLFEIENNRVVKDGEYFLISHCNKSNSAINAQRDNTKAISDFDYGEFQIKLYTDSGKTTLIDTAGDGTSEPIFGDKNNFYSMERKSAPNDGTDYNNWHTCLDQTSTALYWDNGRAERGTPGAESL